MCVKRLMVIGLVVFLALVLWVDLSYAALLFGIVKKADGSTANSGSVTITVLSSGYRRTAPINTSGQYWFNITAGVYRCSAESAGQSHPAHTLLKVSVPQRHDIRLQR